MKNVKVSDDVHAELGLQSQSAGITMSVLIGKLLSGSGVKVKSDPLEFLSGQVQMMFDLLVEIDGRLDSPQKFSESTKGPMVSLDRVTETIAEKAERVRREHQEMLKSQKHAIWHPEDIDQREGWT